MIRTRIAPSPTGQDIHVGSVATALMNFAWAKKNKGKFIIRIEDTDQTRLVPGGEKKMLATLEKIGLAADESPIIGGPFKPYRQSERLSIYKKYAEELVKKGKAYYCICTQERLATMRQEQQAQKKVPRYDRVCFHQQKEITEKITKEKIPYVIRLLVPEGEIKFKDVIRGEITIQCKDIDDQVLLKSDGFPTYHLGVVVDDHLMKITHVIRGEEWLSSTPKHVLLYDYFGWVRPVFAHLPLLLNADKSKLSKRQGDVAVEDYRDKGFLKEALINFVALLGWNAGDDREYYKLNELEKYFSLDRVNKSGAVFNVEKLSWLNFEHLRQKPVEEVLVLLKDELNKSKFSGKTYKDEYLIQVIASMRERVSFVKEYIEKSPYFFEEPDEYDPDVVKKRWKEDSPILLKTLAGSFSLLNENASKEEFEQALHKTAEESNSAVGKLIHPLRLAVSGMGVGPGVYDLLVILGRDEVIRRINTAIEKINI